MDPSIEEGDTPVAHTIELDYSIDLRSILDDVEPYEGVVVRYQSGGAEYHSTATIEFPTHSRMVAYLAIYGGGGEDEE